MKRLTLAIALLFVLFALISCSATVSPLGSAAPLSASPIVQTPAPMPAAATPMPEPAAPGPTPGATVEPVYKSEALGLSFAVPKSWAGKYRVEEQEGCVIIFFSPEEPMDAEVGDGELFSINVKQSEIDELLYGDAVEFDINGITYICGAPKDKCYQTSQPEYETYMAMQNDLSEVFASIRTSAGQLPDHIVNNPKPAPMSLRYTSKKLGITFSMPDSWKGKYTVKEGKGRISVYFKPKKPLAEENGSGFFFAIERKTKETPVDILDVHSEFKINGVKYICYGSTSVEYAGEEEDVYFRMADEIWAIADTIRAVK